MSILAAYMVPHPPMIVPAIGRGSEAQIRETTAAYQQAAAEIAGLQPDTIIITSPHSVMYGDYFHISPGGSATGSFAEFGAPQVSFREEYDEELVHAICDLAEQNGFPAGTLGERDKRLDHGTMVPLWFIRQAYEAAAKGKGVLADAEEGKAAGLNDRAEEPSDRTRELKGRAAESSGRAAERHVQAAKASGRADIQSDRDEGSKFRIVRIGLSGLPLSDHYRLGQLIRRAVHDTGRRAVLIASGDLSHKLQEYGPYGFASEGPEYDARIMDVCSRAAFGELLEFDESFCNAAAECGHRSFVIMAGAFDGQQVTARRLAHQDVTGVGYGICTFYPGVPDEDRRFLDRYLERIQAEAARRRSREDEYVQLARRALETYVLRRQVLRLEDLAPDEPGKRFSPDEPAREPGFAGSESALFSAGSLPAELLHTRAGAFVSIHKEGALRGCIGTIGPTKATLAEEIIGNAISAATADPRFTAIGPSELPFLEISVDVLGEPEDIGSEAELDVKRYGVIVRSGSKRGLLLPDLDGVDTVKQQVEIAKQKAGIHRFEKVKLQRFEVIRHE